jgi:H/ACA ribonucleoprotein complex subunit 2
MGKEKKEKKAETSTAEPAETTIGGEMSYEDKLSYVAVIAKPMANKKLAKKAYKLIKKGMKHKTFVRNGLKDVQSRIRKGERGLVVFAGDVTPVEVMCHLPAVCEEKDIPYVYTPSRQDLGTAMGVKRGSLMVLIREHEDYKELYDEVEQEMKSLPPPVGVLGQ